MTGINFDRPIDLTVNIPTADASIEGDWSVPPAPRGAIIIANGVGHSRLSKGNREIARRMYDAGFALLLLDILTDDEEVENALTGAFRLDINLFARRLHSAIDWVKEKSDEGHLPLGILASGTASAAALIVATRQPECVNAIVSRGGRPDLAGIALHRVLTPTLFIVGSNDPAMYELNRWALRRINGEKHLAVIQGESQPFEPKKTLDTTARVAIGWFASHMSRPALFEPNKGIFGIAWTPGSREEALHGGPANA